MLCTRAADGSTPTASRIRASASGILPSAASAAPALAIAPASGLGSSEACPSA